VKHNCTTSKYGNEHEVGGPLLTDYLCITNVAQKKQFEIILTENPKFKTKP